LRVFRLLLWRVRNESAGLACGALALTALAAGCADEAAPAPPSLMRPVATRPARDGGASGAGRDGGDEGRDARDAASPGGRDAQGFGFDDFAVEEPAPTPAAGPDADDAGAEPACDGMGCTP
jgi:hypothetical protein